MSFLTARNHRLFHHALQIPSYWIAICPCGFIHEPTSVHRFSCRSSLHFDPMEVKFDRLPDYEGLKAAFSAVDFPISVEISQEGGYYELIDCETVSDLYDFLVHDELGIEPPEPFAIDYETVCDEPEETWETHPSLTVNERNR